MKAVRLHESGSVANYVYEDAPDPGPGAREQRQAAEPAARHEADFFPGHGCPLATCVWYARQPGQSCRYRPLVTGSLQALCALDRFAQKKLRRQRQPRGPEARDAPNP